MKRLFFIIAFLFVAAFSQAVPVRVWVSASGLIPGEFYYFSLILNAFDYSVPEQYVPYECVAPASGSFSRMFYVDWDSSLFTSIYLDFYRTDDDGSWLTDYVYLDSARSYSLAGSGVAVVMLVEPISNTPAPDFLSVSKDISFFVQVAVGVFCAWACLLIVFRWLR